MAETSTIEWTDATWNPITGCSVVSPGCQHCYAMKLAGTRLAQHPSRANLTQDTKAGPVWTGEVRFNPQWLDQPLRWRRPRRIFVCAHGDLFHEKVPDSWIDKVFAVMAAAPWHTFQVLTKRPERMRAYMDRCCGRVADAVIARRRAAGDKGGVVPLAHIRPGAPWWPLPNVWLGVSAEDQQRADERIPHLLATPAAVRFLSAEPLLGAMDLTRLAFGLWDDFKDVGGHPDTFYPPGAVEWGYGDALHGEAVSVTKTPDGKLWWENAQIAYRHLPLDWVIVGGESGPGARPMHPDWARSLRDQCAAAGVPFFFKQWGGWTPGENVGRQRGVVDAAWWSDGRWIFGKENLAVDDGHIDDEPDVYCLGKKAAGRLLDGVMHDAMPGAAP